MWWRTHAALALAGWRQADFQVQEHRELLKRKKGHHKNRVGGLLIDFKNKIPLIHTAHCKTSFFSSGAHSTPLL